MGSTIGKHARRVLPCTPELVVTEPSTSESLPPSAEILQRLRALGPPPRPIDRQALAPIDTDHLRADLEALARGLAEIRALIRPPYDLPPVEDAPAG